MPQQGMLGFVGQGKKPLTEVEQALARVKRALAKVKLGRDSLK
jgi:hypothetical protein